MKKICAIFVLAILSGFVVNCGQAPPPQNEFRLKTRVKFRLFGFVSLFSIPAPFQQINLKTNTMPGSPNTTGSKSEFDPNGAFVFTDHVGKFDTVNAVLPATWTVKRNPNQPIQYPCMYPASESFSAQGGKTYRYNCSIDVLSRLTSNPSSIYIGSNGSPNPPISLEGSKIQKPNGESVFSNAENLRVQYYRLTGIDTSNGDNEDVYQLETEKNPTSISSNGTEVTIPYPDGIFNPSGFLINNRTKVYHIVLTEDGTYIGHTPFYIDFPEQCPGRTRVCP